MNLNYFKNLTDKNNAISLHTREHYIGYWLPRKYGWKIFMGGYCIAGGKMLSRAG